MDSGSGAGRVDRLRDGTPVRLRPIGPADRARLAAGFTKLSPDSRYRRFFTAMPTLPDSMLDRLVATDAHNHVAIGAEVAGDDAAPAEGLGVARFIRLADAPDVAEIAVAVIDEYQGRGLGHLLLEALVEAARASGIKRFRASVQADNTRVRSLLDDIGADVTVRFEDGCLVYEIPLPEHPAQELRSGVLYRLLKLAAGGLEFMFRALR